MQRQTFNTYSGALKKSLPLIRHYYYSRVTHNRVKARLLCERGFPWTVRVYSVHYDLGTYSLDVNAHSTLAGHKFIHNLSRISIFMFILDRFSIICLFGYELVWGAATLGTRSVARERESGTRTW